MNEAKTAPLGSARDDESAGERLLRPPTRPLRSQPVPVEKNRTLPGMAVQERKQRDRRNAAIVLLLIAVICLMGEAVLLLPRSSPSPWLGVSLHSVLAADYNADLNPAVRPVVGLGLLGDIYGEEGSYGIDSRMATMEASLLTPVPSVTPLPGTVYPTATVLIAVATASPAPTHTQPGSTSTPGASPTATQTPTQTTTPTATLAGWTPSRTRTPTRTPLATETEPAHPTATQPAPTQPPTATQPAPTRTPTATNPPPTPTHLPTETPDPYPDPTAYP